MASSIIKQTSYKAALTFESGHTGSANLIASGNVGCVYGYFQCQADSESVKIYIPDGYVGIPYGITIRDQNSGTLINAWTTSYSNSNNGHTGASIETYLHSGTMVVGHNYNFAIMVIK